MAVDPIRGAGDPRTRVAGAQIHAHYEAHARMVYGLCRALLRDPDDADDATQATFVSAYRSLLGGIHVREPAAWLATIARNECTTRAQARMREPLPLLEADLRQVPGSDEELARRAVIDELQQAIAGLPEKQREAVVLRDLYGLRYSEVGAALGLSVASVESLLFRARRSLRVSLKPLAGGALTVPIAVREGIAQALPALTAAGAARGGAASGAVGLGLFTKLAGGPIAGKAAAGLAAAVAAGSIAVAGVERADRPSTGAGSRSSGQIQGPGGGEGGAGAAKEVASFAAIPASSRSTGSDRSDDRAGPQEQEFGDGESEAGGEGQGGDGRDDIGSTHGERGEDADREGGTSSRTTPGGARSEHSEHTSGNGGEGESSGGHGDDKTAADGEHGEVIGEETSHAGKGDKARLEGFSSGAEGESGVEQSDSGARDGEEPDSDVSGHDDSGSDAGGDPRDDEPLSPA